MAHRVPFASALLLACGLAVPAGAAVGLTVGQVGVSLGNAPRLTGLRLNLSDRDVERVLGVNLTLLQPGPNPAAGYAGVGIGLVGIRARTVSGLCVAGVAVTASQDLRGLAIGGVGAKAPRVVGIAGGLGVVKVRERLDGIAVAGWRVRVRGHTRGAALSLGLTQAGTLTGLAIGGGTTADGARGLVVGLVGAGAEGRVRGIVLGGIGAGAGQDAHGVVLGGIGAGAGGSASGLVLGGVGAGAGEAFTGIVGAGVGAGAGGNAAGIIVGGVGAGAGGNATGIVVGGVGAGAGSHATGLLVGGVGAGAGQDLTGIGLSLVAVGAGTDLRGVAVAGLGVCAGRDLRGLAASLGGIGARESIRGVALAGLAVAAPHVTGLTSGALNGVVVDRISLEEFVHVRRVNQDCTGVAVGLFNYTPRLRGVQLGLLNYAGNNPPWARLLPFLNLHLSPTHAQPREPR